MLRRYPLFFAAVLLLLKLPAQNGWITHATCGTEHLEGIDNFTLASWTAVGNNGAIYRTINSGVTWTSQNSTTQMPLHDINCPSSSIGYAVGDSGIILKTINSGVSWTRQISGTIMPVRGVFFQNTSVGYACGWAGNIIKTTNGGATWNIQSLPLSSNFNDIYFISSTTGYTVGWSGIIYKTSDGGINWAAQTSGVTANLNKVFFTDSLTGFCAGGSGTLLHTTDGGSNWNIVAPFTSDEILSVCFTNPLLGFCGTYGGQIFGTTDGGITWSSMTCYPYNANDIIALNGTRAIASCQQGNVQETVFYDWFQLPSNTNNCTKTSFANDTVGYAINNSLPAILKTTDGIHWTAIYTPPTPIDDIEFVSESTGYLVRGTTLYKTIDGGLNWTTTQMTDIIYDFDFFSADTAVAYGTGIPIMYTVNGGINWKTKPVPNISTLEDYKFFDLDTGYIVGFAITDKIYFTKDGGSNWQQMFSGNFQRMFFTNKNVGFLWNQTFPILYKTTNAARTFQQLTLPSQVSSGYLIDVYFVDSLTGYISGYNSSNYFPYLYKTTDGGITWVTQTCGYPSATFNSLRFDFPDKNHGYCTTGDGIVKNVNSDIVIGNNPPYLADPFIRQAAPSYAWTMQPGDTPSFQNVNDSKDALVNSTATDYSNNIVFGGTFFDKCQIDTFHFDSPYDQQAIFLGKVTEQKSFAWVIPFYVSGPATTIPTEITSLECDQFNNIYVGGIFGGVLTIGTHVLNAATPGNFIIKLDSAGTVLWATSFIPNATSADHYFHISPDPFGDIVMTGNYSGMMTIGSHNIFPGGHCFIGKYNFQGALQWLIQSSDSLNTEGISCDFSSDGNIIICGKYYTRCRFGNTVMNAMNNNDIFLAKLDEFDGTVIWLEPVNGEGDDYPTDVVCDLSGNIYLTGVYDHISLVNYVTWLYTNSAHGIFYGKFSNTGHLTWINKISSGKSAGITVSNTGECFVTGTINAPCYFADTLLAPAGMNKIFTLKTDPGGNLLWINTIDCSSTLPAQENYASDIAVSGTGNCYITGNVWGYDINSTTGVCNVSTGTATNAAQYGYLAKIGSGAMTIINENNLLSSTINLFPVPATDNINCDLSIFGNEQGDAILYNSLGQELLHEKILFSVKNSFSVEDLEQGIYFLKITGAYFSFTRAFIVSH